MSSAPFSLMLLVPQERADLPAATPGSLHWLRSVDEEDGEESWEVFQGEPENLTRWHQAKRMNLDAPLVCVECLAHDQTYSSLPGHVVVRVGLSTSLSGYVRPPPHSWRVARQVVEALGVTFAWSTSEYALSFRTERSPVPWATPHSTMIFNDRFLREFRLDPTDFEVLPEGQDLYRSLRFGSLWMVQSPEGLGNESAALAWDSVTAQIVEDQALMFALQRVSGLHKDAVQAWLDVGARRRGEAPHSD